MTQSIPENFSTGDWSFVTVASNALPPRDPNEDDDNDEDEERDHSYPCASTGICFRVSGRQG
jgi:hypothetical protein